MTKDQEIAKLKAENKYLKELLERWVRQYGYREPWVVKPDQGGKPRLVSNKDWISV